MTDYATNATAREYPIDDAKVVRLAINALHQEKHHTLATELEWATRHRSARERELEREFRQHEELAAECERAGTDYSKGRAQGIREVIHYARLALAGRKEQE